MSSSDCNSQVQRDFLSGPEPSHQRRGREVGLTLRLGTFQVLPPRFLLASLSPVLCFLPPDLFCFGLLEIRFFGKLSELQNISVGFLKWPLVCHLLACCSRYIRVSLLRRREILQVLRTPSGHGWAAESFGLVFGEEVGWTHWLVRGPRSFCPPLPCRSNKPELCWEPRGARSAQPWGRNLGWGCSPIS